MVNKKMIKKQTLTLTGLVISMLLVVGVFTGMFLWLSSNAENSNISVDSKYNDTYNNLTTISNQVKSDTDEITSNLNNISEADSTFQVAWNGLKGIGKTLLLPVKMISHANDLTETTLGSTNIIPTWAKSLIIAGLIATVVFLILSILTGGNPKL